MTFLFEHTWIWVVFAAIVGFIGYSKFVNDKKNGTLLVTVIVTAVVLIGGVALERFIETDREAIRRTLKEVAAAIVADDLERVKTHIAPDAVILPGHADEGMGMAKLSTVRFSNVNITINDSTVPVTAELRFNLAVRGRPKGNTILGEADFFERYEFTAVFEKHDDRWLATDKIIYDNRFPLKNPRQF